MSDARFLDDPSPRLQSAYRAVHEKRMRGLPFVNEALRVEAVGFAPWKTYWLGVMVTPWSMNLMLLPRDPDVWRALPIGAKRRYTFPAGAFDFIVGHGDDIGDYLACSLFSPVQEFADHATARETAALARAALFDAANAEASEHDKPVTRENGAADAAPGPIAQIEQTLEQPMSRRDLLRARFLDHEPRR